MTMLFMADIWHQTMIPVECKSYIWKKIYFLICISNSLKLLSLQCIRPLGFITYHKLHLKFLLYMISTLAFGQFRLPKQFGLNVYTQLPFQVSPV